MQIVQKNVSLFALLCIIFLLSCEKKQNSEVIFTQEVNIPVQTRKVPRGNLYSDLLFHSIVQFDEKILQEQLKTAAAANRSIASILAQASGNLKSLRHAALKELIWELDELPLAVELASSPLFAELFLEHGAVVGFSQNLAPVQGAKIEKLELGDKEGKTTHLKISWKTKRKPVKTLIEDLLLVMDYNAQNSEDISDGEIASIIAKTFVTLRIRNHGDSYIVPQHLVLINRKKNEESYVFLTQNIPSSAETASSKGKIQRKEVKIAQKFAGQVRLTEESFQGIANPVIAVSQLEDLHDGMEVEVGLEQ